MVQCGAAGSTYCQVGGQVKWAVEGAMTHAPFLYTTNHPAHNPRCQPVIVGGGIEMHLYSCVCSLDGGG